MALGERNYLLCLQLKGNAASRETFLFHFLGWSSCGAKYIRKKLYS
jgi:hypothetical protein